DDVGSVIDAGAEFIVAPDFQPAVVSEAISRGLLTYPGVATISEALAAHRMGSAAVKLFPATQIGVEGLAAWSAVLPEDLAVFAVGGVTETTMRDWLAAGAHGFGLGSTLYSPGYDAARVSERARALVTAYASAAPRATNS